LRDPPSFLAASVAQSVAPPAHYAFTPRIRPGASDYVAVVRSSPLRVLVRYKVRRSRKDTHLHLLCAEGSEVFETLPVAIRNLGPWTGGPEGRG